jgi:3-deoxy-D-manno-octulosonate 8-phosphate phosphatase (KDO 8-P phosphatase)
MNILKNFKGISTFVFDMDGVLTDGTLLILKGTEWLRKMHIKDGYALQLAAKQNYRVVILSKSNSEPVKERLNILGVTDVFMKIPDKREKLTEYIKANGLKEQEVLFMGDDVPDYTCMQIAGLPCCPADAVGDIKKISKYISPFKGGEGCVRDVIEKVLKLHGKWELE